MIIQDKLLGFTGEKPEKRDMEHGIIR